ncbi:pectate lyase [Frankia sp. AgB32]|nr:pectate lyase [Frankia sp. AgB32]
MAVTSSSASAAPSWPSATGTTSLTATKAVSGTFDGALKRYVGSGDLGTDGQSESQDPLFELAPGAVLKNVILGSPAADGVHCLGSCTLQNVWWEDVGEDAATFLGTSSSTTVLVDGGGAQKASDKVFQHNGAGTVTIRNFQVNDFGKLYRSCGNCTKQYQRNVVLDGITVTSPGKTIVGVNTNYGDTARFSKITIVNDSSKNIKICDRYTGNSTGAEPTKTGTGADGKYCVYSTSDLTYK